MQRKAGLEIYKTHFTTNTKTIQVKTHKGDKKLLKLESTFNAPCVPSSLFLKLQEIEEVEISCLQIIWDLQCS